MSSIEEQATSTDNTLQSAGQPVATVSSDETVKADNLSAVVEIGMPALTREQLLTMSKTDLEKLKGDLTSMAFQAVSDIEQTIAEKEREDAAAIQNAEKSAATWAEDFRQKHGVSPGVLAVVAGLQLLLLFKSLGVL